jgi:dTDP-4-dehydrorhamnose reductase
VKVLIVGANGMLGQAVSAEVLLAGISFESKNSQELDICNVIETKNLVSDVGADYVINCAAFTRVDDAEVEVDAAISVNALGAENLANACKAAGSKLIHISTDYVFEGTGSVPYKESDATKPVTVYGKSKLDGETRIIASGVDAYILRTAWLYGAGGKNFVTTMIDLAKRQGQISVVDDQIGQPTSTQQLAKGILSVLEVKPSFGIYNATCKGQTSWFHFAEYIFQALNFSDIDLIPVGSDQFVRPAARPGYSVLSSEKWMANNLRPFLDWESALTKFLTDNYGVSE